jgi:hypothetical protein
MGVTSLSDRRQARYDSENHTQRNIPAHSEERSANLRCLTVFTALIHAPEQVHYDLSSLQMAISEALRLLALIHIEEKQMPAIKGLLKRSGGYLALPSTIKQGIRWDD